MKYDFTKCNNLNFKIKDGTTGYIKVTKDLSQVYLYFDRDKNKCFDASMQIYIDGCSNYFRTLEEFEKWAEKMELEIIPRNPETYTDWKVGDVIQCKYTSKEHTITVKLGPIFYIGENVFVYLADDIKRGFKLVLTDYEKELSKIYKEKVVSFKEGDKVLVRNYCVEEWEFDIFLNYEKDDKYPYHCVNTDYILCIPLNEKTWRLLGTTDDYKEE